MKPLKGTQTEKNLMKAFAGESQARNRYTFYASIAKKEGYQQISQVFTETANNEKEHAERFFNLMLDGLTQAQPAGIEICNAEYPVAKGNTQDNLQYAADGEHHEAYDIYPAFEQTARQEGFEDVANAFLHIASVEKKHEHRFAKLNQNIAQGTVFKKEAVSLWKCTNCGYVHEGLEAPKVCPSCLHPQGYFELYVENF